MAMLRHNNPYDRRRPPAKLPDDVISFRLVCPASIVGGIIGRSGSIVSSICQETKCRIQCQDRVPGSVHQVILVQGSSSIDRRIMFSENDVVVEGGEVSSTQEAVIRVFERMWELEAELEGESEGEGDGVAYCGLLENTTKIGFVIGKGRRNVTRMRRESGAEIIMLPPPICAAKEDQLIQITGATMTVKKALVAVTACLQDFSSMGKDPIIFNRPIEKVYYSNLSDPHREFFPHLSLGPSFIGNSVEDSASPFYSSSADAEENPDLDKKGTIKEFALRMLVSSRAVAGIIGKRGAIVRSLQEASGALISFAAPLTETGEQVVTISALENLDTTYSPVRTAAILVFARSVEVEGQQVFLSEVDKFPTVTLKVLVGADFAGSLSGNGSSVVSEISDVTDADIKLLGEEQVLDCAAQNDVVVQITGDYKKVQNALSEVAGRLRRNLLSSEVIEVMLRSTKGRVGETTWHALPQSVALSPEFEQETIAMHGVDHFGLPLKRSQGLQIEGRRHATPTTYGIRRSRIFAGCSESELEKSKSLVHLMPTVVVDDVGARSFSEGLEQTTASVLQQLSGESLDSGEDNVLTGMSQLGLSDNIIVPSMIQPPKTEGAGSRIPTTKGESCSTLFAESVESESGNTSSPLKIIVGESGSYERDSGAEVQKSKCTDLVLAEMMEC